MVKATRSRAQADPNPEATPAQASQTPREVPITRTTDFRTQYANHLRMRIGNAEFGIYFGVMEELQGIGQIASEHTLIMMTAPVAKQLALALTETIKAYEAQYGLISVTEPKAIDKMAVLEAIAKARAAAQADN